MHISAINIQNYKCFKGRFHLLLNNGLNILVGDNEAGKSTILEAIHLVLTGVLSGKYVKHELTQHLFNNEVIDDYLQSLRGGTPIQPPEIVIEAYLSGPNLAAFDGDDNLDKVSACGLSLKIAFDPIYQLEYEAFVATGNVNSLPVEYYDVTWRSFARDGVTGRSIPIKSAFIDASSTRFANGSDIYISRLIKEFLDPDDVVKVSQAHRKMRESFMEDFAVTAVNSKINSAINISNKTVTLSVDMSSKNAWEGSLNTYLDDVPFHQIGKGEQCMVKTKLALSNKKTLEANVLLLEEPENHLSHTKLCQLIGEIKKSNAKKQIVISTHSSYVANKLGLGSLILLNRSQEFRFNDLTQETKSFFERLAGYDTLRLILCEKAILVEGDSDELIVQRAYMKLNDGRIPIEAAVDVISVGMSFLRFLEIAVKIGKPVAVVTDNDGDLDAVRKKYEQYIGANSKPNIRVCYDATVHTGNSIVDGVTHNYNTLEPSLLRANNLARLNTVLKTNHESDEKLLAYMHKNKTECAMRIFNSQDEIDYPEYILEAIQ